jgi:hypothetical protein
VPGLFVGLRRTVVVTDKALIYEQSAVRTLREQQEKRPYV